METLETINKRLRDCYGSDVTGRFPRYRVVWSDAEFEMRKAEVNVFVAEIFLRTDYGAQLLPKYPFIKARHVFEFYCPTDNPELINGKENYEPLYVFQDKYDQALPLVWWVVEFLAKTFDEGERAEIPNEEEFMRKEYEYYFDIIDEELPEVPTVIGRGGGVVLDKTDFWKES